MLKKSIFISLLSIYLTACSSSTEDANSSDLSTIAVQMGKKALMQTIEQQCQSYLQELPAYEMMTSVLSEQQVDNLENNMCSCIARKAPENLSFTEIANAAVDETERHDLAQKVIINTLTSCGQEALQSGTAEKPAE